jgi:diketogulonate reductase-like aldo/keto reductase
MSNLSPILTLNNKNTIPQMGFGVFLISSNDEAENVV